VSDPELYRVCDECDTKMDNYTIQFNHEEVIAAQNEKIAAMNNNIEELDSQKQK
jgi:hypothetical protein